MAIQPIDLQALFAQMDKVGKTQALQKEGLQIQQALQQLDSQKKAEQQVRSVNEAQDMGDGAERIKDGGRRRYSGGEGGGKEEEAGEEEEKNAAGSRDEGFIRDPTLGRNIDISG